MIVNGINPTAVRTSAEGPQFAPGTRAAQQDENGYKEYVYVLADEAITAAGYVVLVDADHSAEMVDTTSSAPGAGAGKPVGVAMAAIASGGYGWLQIYGPCSVRTLASAAANTELTSSATPGAVDDATTSGLEVIDGLIVGTATGGAEATNTDGFASYPRVGRTL